MHRLKTPVASMATDSLRARTRRPGAANEHSRIDIPEILRPSDFDLGQLFSLAREAMVVANLNSGRIALWNPAAERLFGYTAAEAIGQSLELLVPAPIIRLYRADADLNQRAGLPGATVESIRPFEVPVRTRGGQEIQVELTLAPLDLPNGIGRYLLAQMRDVSTMRRAEIQNVEVARAEAARVDAEQAVGHHQQVVEDGLADLRREVSRLRRSVDRLSQHLDRTEDLGAQIRSQVIQARTDRVRRELDLLATTSAIEAHALELRPQRVNLVPLVSRTVARLRARGTAHKLNVALPQGLTALVDAERVEQVVEALLEHAITRNPRGCWIDIDLRRPLVGLARLEVRDFGRAVSAEARQHLLRGARSDRELALVRAIVDLHGGRLSFEFPPDGGVRAVATLPTQRGRVANER